MVVEVEIRHLFCQPRRVGETAIGVVRSDLRHRHHTLHRLIKRRTAGIGQRDDSLPHGAVSTFHHGADAEIRAFGAFDIFQLAHAVGDRHGSAGGRNGIGGIGPGGHELLDGETGEVEVGRGL